MYRLGYKYWENLKRRKQRREKLKEIGEAILVIIIMLTAMALGGFTYPY